VNAAYYILLPWSDIALTDAIAVVRVSPPLSEALKLKSFQTAIKNLLGKTAGFIFAALICLVIMGALSGNSFVAGRLTVAAANKRYLPRFFGVIGRFGPEKKRKEPGEGEPDEEETTPRFDAPL
jgi:L-type amino acid transporter 9